MKLTSPRLPLHPAQGTDKPSYRFPPNAAMTPATVPWLLRSKGRLFTSRKALLAALPAPVLLGESQSAGVQWP